MPNLQHQQQQIFISSEIQKSNIKIIGKCSYSIVVVVNEGDAAK